MITAGVEVLGVIEFSSIAIGLHALDEMVKIAPIRVIDARTICPGKYILVFTGDVASVEYSYTKGIEIGAAHIVDQLYLPLVHEDVVSSIGNIVKTDKWGSIGIIETNSVVSGIEAADAAAKTGGVKIVEIRLAIGFGGKSYVKLMGDLDSVQAAMTAGTDKARAKNLLCAETLIPQPHEEIRPYFFK